MKYHIALIGFLWFVSGANAEGERIDHANVFVSAFGQTCEAYGAHSMSAIEMNDRFIGVLHTLRDDPQCTAMYRAMDTAHDLNSELLALGNADKPGQLPRMEKSQLFLNDVLTSFPSTILEGGVTPQEFKEAVPFTNSGWTLGRSVVNSRRFDSTWDNGGVLGNSSSGTNARNSLDGILLRYLTNLNSAINSSSDCLVGRPNLVYTLIGQVMAVAGTYTKSHFGAAMVVAGSVLNQLNETIRTLPFNTAIDAAVVGKLYGAMACGAEAITENYCRTLEAKNFLKVRIDLVSEPRGDSTEVWEGLRILVTEYKAVRNWFREVVKNVVALDRDTAKKLIEAQRRASQVRDARLFAAGEAIDFGDRIRHTSIPEERRSLIQQYVSSVTDFLFNSQNTPNPFAEFFPFGGKCLFQRSVYWGLGQVPKNPEGSSCEKELVTDAANVNEFKTVVDHMNGIVNAVEGVVESETQRMRGKTKDPDAVWLQATTPDPLGLQVLRVFEHVEAYLKSLSTRWTTIVQNRKNTDNFYLELQIRQADETVRVVRNVIDLIRAPKSNSTSLEKLGVVSQAFHLDDQFNFLVGRISDLIDVDISERVRAGETNQDVSELVRLAALDYYDGFGDGGGATTVKMFQDFATSLSIGQGTIDNFVGFSGPYFVRGVNYFKKLSREAGEDGGDNPVENMNLFNAAKICVLAIAASDSVIEKKVLDRKLIGADRIREVCENMVLRSPLTKAPGGTIVFKELYNKPWKDRVCAFHKLNKLSRMYEIGQNQRN